MRWDDRTTQIRATYGEAIRIVLVLGALAVLAVASKASAQTPQRMPVTNVTAPAMSFNAGQSAKVKGLIISRDGDDMTIRDENGYVDVITLTADTRISSPSGLFKTDKKQRDVTNLLPGLIVEVRGNGGSRGNLVADRISFHSSALRVAQQIAAGEVMLSRRVNANSDSISALKERAADSLATLEARARDSLSAISARFDDIDRYDMKDSTTVTFKTGSAELSEEAKAKLNEIADRGAREAGYLVEITGYADTTGRAMMNQNLSVRRAEAVVAYLSQNRDVPLRRILNPTGFGTAQPVAPNDTPEGRAMNRRAVVKILVNRAKQK